MNNELYFNELLKLLNDNTMINYEDTYSDFYMQIIIMFLGEK